MPQGTGEGHGRFSSRPRVVRQWGKSSKPDQSTEHQDQKTTNDLKNKVSEIKRTSTERNLIQ